jgi:hypothetical protein
LPDAKVYLAAPRQTLHRLRKKLLRLLALRSQHRCTANGRACRMFTVLNKSFSTCKNKAYYYQHFALFVKQNIRFSRLFYSNSAWPDAPYLTRSGLRSKLLDWNRPPHVIGDRSHTAATTWGKEECSSSDQSRLTFDRLGNDKSLPWQGAQGKEVSKSRTSETCVSPF